MADGQYERIETDSTADLQLSVADSGEPNVAADDRASDADYGEASDIYDEDTAAAARDAVSESPTSDRPQVSDTYRDMSQPPDQADVEAWEDSRQTPVNTRDLPPTSVAGAGNFGFDVSTPRAGEPSYAFPVEAGLPRTDLCFS